MDYFGMRKGLQILGISLACIGVYMGMRSLPLEPCSFLHYGDYVNAEGVIEGCGYEESDFFFMEDLRYPILAEFTPLEDLEVGKEGMVKLTLFTTTGKPIDWRSIAVSHTERIHAMVVDSSLEDYHHLHPRPEGPAGHYLFQFTPRRAGTYKVYLDMIPLINSRRTLLHGELSVSGSGSSPALGHRLRQEMAGYTFEFHCENAAHVTGEDLIFRLEVSSNSGSPFIFEPVMDSYAHVVAFDEFRSGFAHLHPLNPFIEGQDPADPDLRFQFNFQEPGHYRIWVQMQLSGLPLMVPFDLKVSAADAFERT